MSEATTTPGEPRFPQRYGPEDEIGAANEITEETVRQAIALVRQGKRITLGQVLEDGAPTQMTRYWKHALGLGHILPGQGFGSNKQTFVEETVSGALHSGTHLDGLGHIGFGPLTYNGIPYADIATSEGLSRLGIESVPPIVTRGVLLDISATQGAEMLADRQPIGADDLEAACQRQGVQVSPGDAIIVHTGWGALWMKDNERYAASEPGLDVSAAAWCTDRRVSVIGADNWAVEVVPNPDESVAFPVHQHCIARYGVYLLENARTEDLVREGVSVFCLVLLPVRIKGASASPVAPVALV